MINLLATRSHLAPEVAAETYADMLKPGGYEKDARFDVDAFKSTLKLRAETEGDGPIVVENVVEPRFVERAQRELGLK